MRVMAALFVLVLSRAAVLAGHAFAWSWWSPIAYLWQDAAVVVILSAIDYGLRRTPRLAWTMYLTFVMYVAASVPVFREMSTPMTWPMWRAAGAALSDSTWYYVTPVNVLWVGVLLIAGTAAPCWLRRAPQRAVIAMCCGIAALGPLAASRVETHGLERNAWSALVFSMVPHIKPARTSIGALSLSAVGCQLSDLAESRELKAESDEQSTSIQVDCGVRAEASAAADWRDTYSDQTPVIDLARFRGAAAGRHVILVSLESTAAQYLALYGASPDVMPNLSDLSKSAIVFDKAYAVYPESIKGLFSILCSTYPAFDVPVDRYTDAPCQAVASILSARGYRTALFHSGRFGYLGMDAVVRRRGYNVLADAGDIGGNHESSFGVDDRTTAVRALDWIDGVAPGERFFLTYLPIAGHHPYEVPEAGPFPDHDELGRYRNALHYGDAVLGSLIRGLRARGMEQKALWIIFGDHGEAFGQHDGNVGHTFQLYEENVRVPFIVAAPGLIAQPLRAPNVVSLIDTAPTLLDLLGIPAPASYQGRSMLNAERRRALFFADYSLGLVGLRDGPMKYVYELESGRAQLFDLDRDPRETHNLADRDRHDVRQRFMELRAWSAAQKSYLSP